LQSKLLLRHPRVKCAKCGGKRVDVRPNWKEKAGMPDGWQGRSAWESDAALVTRPIRA
jgi:hypothetical protein